MTVPFGRLSAALAIWLLALHTVAAENQLLLDEPVIMELRLGSYVLNDAMIAYPRNGRLLLPLGELASALDFVIDVSPSEGAARGWFIRENRKFHLDLTQGQVLADGQSYPLRPEHYLQEFDDIYIDSGEIGRWFPLEFEYNLSRLRVTLRSREKLPIQERWGREQLRAKLGRQPDTDNQNYSRLPTRYNLIQVPSLDLDLFSDYPKGGEHNLAYSSRVSGDLLGMSASLYLQGQNRGGLDDARLTFERTDPYGSEHGITELALGDIFTPSLDSIAAGRRGRGAYLSTFELQRPDEFDSTVLRGELPLGWEVELYRNDALLESQSSRGDGLYEFVDIPLLYGNNFLRLVFYGPQGQIREQVEQVFIGNQRTRPGSTQFKLGANQQGRDLIRVEPEEEQPASGSGRFTLEVEHGISTDWGLAARAAHLPSEDSPEHRDYLSLGLRSSLLGAYSRLDLIAEDGGGEALEFATQTQLGPVNLSLEQALYQDFNSEALSANDPMRWRSSIRLDGTVPEGVFPRLPLSCLATFQERESGESNWDISQRTSFSAWNFNASNILDYHHSSRATNETQLSGNFAISQRLFGFHARAGVDYRLKPTAKIDSYGFSSNHKLGSRSGWRLDLTHDLNNDLIRYGVGLTYEFDQAGLGVEFNGDDSGDYAIALSLSMSLGYEPRRASWFMKPKDLADDGAVSARAFLDANQNGVFDASDQPLEGVTYKGGYANRPSDADGITLLSGFQAGRPARITLQTGSLTDPFWIAARPDVEFVPRPGKVMQIDFPVVASGEIDGTVTLLKGGAEKEVSNVEIQLVDDLDQVVETQKSAFDGFYLFSGVKPGNYQLRVSPEQLKRLGLSPLEAVEVTMGADGEVISGLDFQLRQPTAESLAQNSQSQEPLPPSAPVVQKPLDTKPDLPPNNYALQFGYFRDRANATQLVNILRDQGVTYALTIEAWDGGYLVQTRQHWPADTAKQRLASLNQGVEAILTHGRKPL